METNKRLQNLIGNAIGKDYFKLEFGCKFIFKLAKENLSTKDGLYTVTESRLPVIYVMSEEDGEHHDGFFTIDNFEDNPEEFEILGQEPTLNDVLLAIEKSNIRKRGCIDLSIDDNYLEVFCDENYEFETLLVRIDLEKSIFNQEEEVKVTIINLLEDK